MKVQLYMQVNAILAILCAHDALVSVGSLVVFLSVWVSIDLIIAVSIYLSS